MYNSFKLPWLRFRNYDHSGLHYLAHGTSTVAHSWTLKLQLKHTKVIIVTHAGMMHTHAHPTHCHVIAKFEVEVYTHKPSCNHGIRNS